MEQTSSMHKTRSQFCVKNGPFTVEIEFNNVDLHTVHFSKNILVFGRMRVRQVHIFRSRVQSSVPATFFRRDWS